MSLTVRRLSVTAPGVKGHETLHSVDFHVRPGEIVGILGHAGSGKSALVSAIAGAVPSGGSIEVSGPGCAGRVPVAALVERPEAMFVAATAAQEVEFALDLLDAPTGRKAARCMRAFSAVGLDAALFAEREPRTLSTGEQRRLALAAVLAVEPAYLCLDEPAAGLDLEGRKAVGNVLQSLKAGGIGIIIAGSDSGFLWRLSDRLHVLDGGRLTASVDTVSPGDIVELLREQGFELPDDLALWAMLCEQGLMPVNTPVDVAAMAAALEHDPEKGRRTPC